MVAAELLSEEETGSNCDRGQMGDRAGLRTVREAQTSLASPRTAPSRPRPHVSGLV